MKISTDKKENTVLSGAAFLALSVIVVKVIGFLFKLPLSEILGDNGMGYFNSAYTVFTFFYMLCTGGVPRAVSILISEARAREEEDSAECILRYALGIFLFIGTLFSIALMALADKIALLIGNDLAAFSLVCIAPSLTFVAASGVLRGYLTGDGRMLSVALAEILEGVVKFIFGLTFSFYASGKGYENSIVAAYAVLGVSLGSMVGAIVLYIASKIHKTNNKARQKSRCKLSTAIVMGKIIRISFPLALSAAVMGIGNMIDLGMIPNKLVSAGITVEEAVALYGNFTTLAVPMLNLVMALLSPVFTSCLPVLARMNALEKKQEFADFTRSILCFISLLSAPVASVFLFFPYEILSVLFNSTSSHLAAPLLSALASSVIAAPLLTVCNTAHEASSRQVIPLFSMLCGSLAKLVSEYFLIPRIGISGAPLSTAVCYGVALVISFACMLSYIGIDSGFLISLFVPYFTAFNCFLTVRLIYKHLTVTVEGSLIRLALLLIPGMIVYLTVTCFVSRKRLLSMYKIVSFAQK